METRLSDEWATPQWLFDDLNYIYGPFTIDVCANDENAKCDNYFTPEIDALSVSWETNHKVWMNPPYSDPSPWVEKAVRESYEQVVVGALLPADHSVRWYQKYIENNPNAKVVERFPFRIKFDPPKNWTGNISGPRGAHIFVLFTPLIRRPQ